MKTMKVKELKAILEHADDEQGVVIDDANDMCIAIVGGGEFNEAGIHLHTQQEFPAEWFDNNGDEIDWEYHSIKRETDLKERSEIYICDKQMTGGREIYVTLTFHDGYAVGDGVMMRYPTMAELTNEQIDEIDRYTGGRVKDSGCITPNDVCLKYGELTSFGIMTTSNNHDENLVRDINVRWVEDREMFKPILLALYERDINEITDADSFQYSEWHRTPEYSLGIKSKDWSDYNAMALAIMKNHWESYAQNYLMHIADNQDLGAIIRFVRYDRSENA